MPRCEICEEVVEDTYTCRECGTNFCEECGDNDNRVCILCRSQLSWNGQETSLEEQAEGETQYCEICGEQAEELYECQECEAYFCLKCGNPKIRLCRLCLDD